RALEAMHLGRNPLEAAVDDAVHFLGVAFLGEAREAREVGEEHGDLAALTLERRARFQDFVGEMLGRVYGTVARRRRRRGLLKTLAAVAAEAEVGRRVGAAVRAARGEGGATAAAEAHAGRALEAALRASGRGRGHE